MVQFLSATGNFSRLDKDRKMANNLWRREIGERPPEVDIYTLEKSIEGSPIVPLLVLRASI